ncbi:MAG: hypothetical protein RLZZ184_3674 [Cyanobacteriota bacterium]
MVMQRPQTNPTPQILPLENGDRLSRPIAYHAMNLNVVMLKVSILKKLN